MLSRSLDHETTLGTVAQLPLPQLGAWCIVDLCGPDGTVRRLAVVHPDPEKQALALRQSIRRGTAVTRVRVREGLCCEIEEARGS